MNKSSIQSQTTGQEQQTGDVCRIRISEQELETGADKLYTRVGIRAGNRSYLVCIHTLLQKKETGAGAGSEDRSCIRELGQ